MKRWKRLDMAVGFMINFLSDVKNSVPKIAIAYELQLIEMYLWIIMILKLMA